VRTTIGTDDDDEYKIKKATEQSPRRRKRVYDLSERERK